MKFKYLFGKAPPEHQIHEKNGLKITFVGSLDEPVCEKGMEAKRISELYLLHGTSMFNDLYGAYNILIEDEKNKRYYAVNDCLSQMGLYYVQKPNEVLLSYLPSILLEQTGVDLNTWKIKTYFALLPQLTGQSFFNRVEQLDIGHYLAIKNKLNTVKYYELEAVCQPQKLSFAQARERFEAVLFAAVKRASSRQSKVAVMMSGGLDSTLIAAFAHKLGLEVSSHSYVFPTMPEANEGIWIESMHSIVNRSHMFAGENYWPLKPPWHVSLNAPYSNPYRHLKTSIYSSVKNHGSDTLLTGGYADHIYTGYQYWFNDLIKKHPIKALNRLYSLSKDQGFRLFLKSWYRLFVPVTPDFNWLNKGLKKEMSEAYSAISSQHHRPRQFLLNRSVATAESGHLELEYALQHGINIRHPFRDKDLVELGLGIPAWLLGDVGNKKRLARKIAEKYVPASIYQRSKVSTLVPLLIKGVLQKEQQLTQGILQDSACDWFDFIDAKIIQKILKNPNDSHSDKALYYLYLCLSYEMWKKQLSKY